MRAIGKRRLLQRAASSVRRARRTLGHLAVLLGRPAVRAAELVAAHVTRELARQHQPLIGESSTRDLPMSSQLVAQQRESLDVGASVGDLSLRRSSQPASGSAVAIAASIGLRPLERAPAIVDP